jgi:hypothetical protein
MPTTTPTILDQIIAEKTKISERLARLDTDRAAVATRPTDLETAERVLTRVSKTPPARRTTSAAAAEAKAQLPAEAAGGRQEPPPASQRDANPAHRAWASVSWPWPPAGLNRNFTWRAPMIGRTMSASQCSAISAPDGSRSVTPSCTRHRRQHSRRTRQPGSCDSPPERTGFEPWVPASHLPRIAPCARY